MGYSSKNKSSETLLRMESHWKDLAFRCDRDQRPYFSNFVLQEDIDSAEKIAASVGVTCIAWGGTEGASRVMLCFAPESFPVETERFPLRCLTFAYRSGQKPEHRDFLGAIMACNLERETIGDILIDDRMAQIFVCTQVSAVILQEIQQIGRIGVHITDDEPVRLSAQTAFCPINGTIASLRADAIIAFVTHLSREKATQLIRQGNLVCHYTTIETPSAKMQVGDVFSIRGFGKFRLDTVDGLTRKGRYHITIQKYQ